jgi:hypothetical protein
MFLTEELQSLSSECAGPLAEYRSVVSQFKTATADLAALLEEYCRPNPRPERYHDSPHAPRDRVCDALLALTGHDAGRHNMRAALLNADEPFAAMLESLAWKASTFNSVWCNSAGKIMQSIDADWLDASADFDYANGCDRAVRRLARCVALLLQMAPSMRRLSILGAITNGAALLQAENAEALHVEWKTFDKVPGIATRVTLALDQA